LQLLEEFFCGDSVSSITIPVGKAETEVKAHTYVETQQLTPPPLPPKDSPRPGTNVKLFGFAFIILPASVLIVAYGVTPSSWGIHTWTGTILSLCVLAVVFMIGVYIVKWGNLKMPRSAIGPSPSRTELAFWLFVELLQWLVIFLVG
jgi:hypothetical protein